MASRRIDATRIGQRLRAGTPRNPGADLSRLPWGLDLGAVRMAEGIRAALACGLVLLANEWLGWPPLVYMAMAAFFTCLCDIGGPIRFRVPALLAFTMLGAVVWVCFGLLRDLGLPVVLPLAFVGLFCLSMARVWGTGATAVGNILSIVLVVSVGQPLVPHEAFEVGAMFICGGLWATLLTMVVWRLHPYRPARNAVSDCWRRLAELAADQRRLLLDGAATEAWDAHGRAHRRAVREELEHARTIVLDLVSMRGRLSLRGGQALLRLEACDQIFGSLIALSDLLEGERDPARLAAAETLLRLLRPMLVVLADAIAADTNVRAEVLERATTRALAATAADPLLRPLAEAMAERLRIAARLSTPGGYLPGGPVGAAQAQPWRDRVLVPLRANLNWESVTLRHALRVAVIGAPAMAVTLDYYGRQFAHWLPITAIVTLQPFFATTWQRALERIGGTVLGGLIGAVIAYFIRAPLDLALVLFPLCTAAFAARQVSFTAWITGVTPIVVVLMELIHPGHSSWDIAGLRALFTLAGGLLAIFGCLFLWPSWEPARLSQEQRNAIAAHADYARAVLSEITDESPAGSAEAARRAAGMATNNLEACISRALQEPRGGRRPAVGTATLVDATLRRIAGRLSALRHDPTAHATLTAAEGDAWRDWITASLGSLTAGDGPLPPRPPLPQGEALLDPLARIARQIELLEGALRRPEPARG